MSIRHYCILVGNEHLTHQLLIKYLSHTEHNNAAFSETQTQVIHLC